jgi:hypothetical protein
VTAPAQVPVPALPRHVTQAPRRVVHRHAPRRVVGPSPQPPQRNPPPAPEPPPPQPVPPPRPPSLIRQVGNQLKQIVEPLPKPVGPVAADAVDTVIDLLDPGGKAKQPVTQVVGSLLRK